MNLRIIVLSTIVLFTSYSAQAQNNANGADKSNADKRYNNSAIIKNEEVADNELPGYVAARNKKLHFNYTFLRISTPISFVSGFNNPLHGPVYTTDNNTDVSGNFSQRGDLTSLFAIGLETGAVKHVAKLGTYLVRLGINYDINLQYYSFNTQQTANANVTSNGAGTANITVGPQVTYMPAPHVRLGIFGRIGVGGIFSDYTNMQNDANEQLRIQMFNIALEEETGIEASYRKLSVGLTFSFLEASPASGQLTTPTDNTVNAYTYNMTTAESSSTVNPKITFSRISFNIGLAF